MAFDVVTYILSKKYTDRVIASLPKPFVYKGAVNYQSDLPTNANVGDVYTVVYKGVSPSTETWGAEFVWGKYEGTLQWIRIGSDFEVEYISLTFYHDGDTGTLTNEQAQILSSSELNYIWLNGMHRCDFRYRDDNNNKATYSACDSSSDGNKIHSVEINLTTKEFKVYHKTLQEYIGDLSTIRSGAALGATAVQPSTITDMATKTWVGEQGYLTQHQSLKTINNESLVGSGNINIKTYQHFDELEGTLQQVVQAIMAFPTKAEGMAYLGSIRGECTPFGYGNVECTVTFMTNSIAVLSCSSSNIAPYHWEYNTAQSDYTWRKWSDVSGTYSGSNWTKITINGVEKDIPVGGGSSDYTQLTNKPQINSVELSGNKTLSNLGIQAEITSSNKLDYSLLSNTPTIPTVTNTIPECPNTTDGQYRLICNVVDGVRTYSWILDGTVSI